MAPSETRTDVSGSSMRDHPYRLLFPLGIVLAWAGVAHWLGFAFGWTTRPLAVFHSIAQIQGFMTCFAVGFVFTAVPRRTRSAAPTTWELAVGAVAPIGTTVFAGFEAFAASQLCWLVLLVTLARFVRTRARAEFVAGGRRPPACFVWLPIALGIGFAGTGLIAAYGMLGLDFVWHDLGRGLLLQGVFLALIAGAGGLALPLITRGGGPADARPGFGVDRVGHVLAAVILIASFVVESFVSTRLGFALRGLVVFAILVVAQRLHVRPSVPGTQRVLAWGAAWALPIGYAFAAVDPGRAQVGLHVVFVLGFALMAFTVSLHVAFAHGGSEPSRARAHRPSRSIAVLGMLVVAAAVARAMLVLDPDRFAAWLGGAAGAFLVATLVWGALFVGARSGRALAGSPRS